MDFGIAVAVLAWAASFASPSGEKPEQLLERMKAVYAACESYRDSGVVQTVFFSERGPRTVRKPFTTAFVRPNRLRYEFLDRRGEYEFDRYLIAYDGSETRRWWDVKPGVGTDRRLEEALAGAAGVSSGSSYTIPLLLMPEEHWRPLSGNPLLDLGNLKRLEDGEIGGRPCLRIVGDRGEDPITLWIEKERMLLRRIEESRVADDYRTQQTTDFEPEIDVSISDELLRFDPPRATAESSAPLLPLRSHEPEPSAEQILASMKDVYARCRSYSDTGVVHEVFFKEQKPRTVRKPFTIAFVRPESFRFEFQDRRGEQEWNRFLVWRAGPEVRQWWCVRPGIETPGSLQMAMAGSLCGGSSSIVPALLMPGQLGAPRLPRSEELERLEDGERDGVACYRLLGRREEGEVFWIEKERMLLLRVEQQRQHTGFRVETTIDHHPVLDAEIAPELLRFDPPEDR